MKTGFNILSLGAFFLLALTACSDNQHLTDVAAVDDAAAYYNNDFYTDNLDGVWRILKYNPDDMDHYSLIDISDDPYLIRFNTKDHSFYCNTDCNCVSGSYFMTDSQLNFDKLLTTNMKCRKDNLQRGLTALLPVIKGFKLSGDYIRLLDEQGHVLLVLQRATSNAKA